MSIQSNFPNLKPSLLLDFANTKQLDNRVTFTRSTPAVYYDGKTTAMAEQNLVQYSQEFDNAVWTKSNTTIVANNTTAPDGTSTADKVVIAANTTYHDAFANGFLRIANQTYTHSIYVKAGTGIPAVYFYTNRDAVGLIAKFDISAGTYIGNAGGDGYGAFDSYSITSVGSGWYRITATFTAISNSSSTFTLGISTTTANTVVPITGNGTDFCYIWGAQLEQRSSATAYTATTTQPITNYIPVLLTAGGNQPRFDCNPTTGESLGLLIEEQRTNINTYSATFDDWGSIGSQSGGPTLVPNGTISGITVNRIGPNNLYKFINVSASTTYTASIYAKANFGTLLNFGFEAGFGVYGVCIFNLSNGTISSTASGTTATITSVGNGWYRCTVTGTTTSGATQVILHIASNGTDYTTAIKVWGAQLEAASFATSYIATTSASATRTADLAYMDGANFSSWYRPNDSTVFVDFATKGSPVNGVFAINDGTVNNIVCDYRAAQGYGIVKYNPNSVTLDIGTSNDGVRTRIAVGAKPANYAATKNAGTISSSTFAVSPPANKLWIGNIDSGGWPLNGTIYKLAYYPLRVTDAQMQALTS